MRIMFEEYGEALVEVIGAVFFIVIIGAMLLPDGALSRFFMDVLVAIQPGSAHAEALYIAGVIL